MIKNIHHFIDILIVLIRRVILISAQPLLGLVLRIERKSRFLTAANTVRYKYLFKTTAPQHLSLRPGHVLERSSNFSGSESCVASAVFAFKIKVSTVLEIIQRNYHLTKQN